MEEPAITSGTMPASVRTRNTPIWDQPRAAPPPRARPILAFVRASRSAGGLISAAPPPPPDPALRRAIPSHNIDHSKALCPFMPASRESRMNDALKFQLGLVQEN